MSVVTDTKLVRIPLATENLEKAIKDACELESARKQGRRLAAAFSARDQLVLIFQAASSQDPVVGE
jgi:hypothetical protein